MFSTQAIASGTATAGFERGFVAEYSNNAHQPVSLKTFTTLGIDSVVISQTTDDGTFGGSQGNDYSVTVTFQFSNGTTSTFPAAVNWRDTQGSTIHGIGLTVAAGTNDGTGYAPRSGYDKTILLQFVGSTRSYADTATGSNSNVVSGNAATNGLLAALNSYRTSSPSSTTPAALTSTISAAPSSIAANGSSTSTVTVQLKDVNGNNISTGGHTVTLSTTAGTLSSVTDNGNGTYTATLTSSTSVTTATITGTVGGFAISDNASVQFVSSSSISGTLTRANGAAVSGRTVQLVNASNQVVASATTASNGSYSFSGVAPGTYSIRFEASGNYKAKARSSTGTNQGNVVASVTVGTASTITNIDAVVIDPAGVIYNSTTRAPVANATISLYYNNILVNNSWLDTGLGGANSQTTGSDGSYSFVLNGSASSGTYELRVAPLSGYNGTPSTAITPSGTYTPQNGGGLEAVQTQATAPTGQQATTYYLLFNFTIGQNPAGTSNGVINNHIPIDPIAALAFTSTNATDSSSNPSYGFTYNENRASGATLGTVSASGSGTLSFSITAGNTNGWFAIDATTGAITLTQAGSTSLANDFEASANIHILTVQVTNSTQSASIEVKLSELDVDDTAPVITGPSGGAGASVSALSVNENQQAVTTLAASEAVSWSIVGGEDSARFVLNPTTGVLTFAAAPDYEAPNDGTTSGANTYIVQVKALDSAGNFALQTITVTVLDVNEFIPASISGVLTRASQSAGIAGRTVTLLDNANNVVATTTTAANGSYSFTNLVPGTYSVRFADAKATSSSGTVSGATVSNIVAGSGAVVSQINAILIDPTGVVYDSISRAPVRNAVVSLYYGNAKVSNSWLDTGLGGSNDQQTGNDGRYSFILSGAASSGIYEVRVTGPSGYRNSESSIISSSGTVTPALGGGLENVQSQTTAPVGAQATTYYLRFNFTFGNSMSSTSNGVANNHIPIDPAVNALAFAATNTVDANNRPAYSFNYNEGRSAGAVLGTVSASGGYTSNRTFSIISGNANGWFAIDSATGAISLASLGATSVANDFEAMPNVQILTVRVSDGFVTANAEVRLNEADVDDSAPLITGPSGGAGATASSVTLDEGIVLAATLTANEAVSWSLAGGADQAKFSINPSTGVLSFLVAPNYESPTDADTNNSYVVQVRAVDTAGNAAFQTVTVVIQNVDEIARKLAQIADPLRAGLRNHAARSLSDMLSFNEQLLADDTVGQCGPAGRKPLSGGFNATNVAQSARLSYARQIENCERRYRVFIDGAMALSHQQGDWMLRTLASVRTEADLSSTVTLGAGVLATFADDTLKGFASSDISDSSVQVNLYGRKRLTDKLRMAAFVGYGKAWYDFGLTDNGFVMSGKMTGDRYTYGATLTGDIEIGETMVTTDFILSHAQERLGTAVLAAAYLGEQRQGIGFYVGNVDVTRLSIPVHVPFDLQVPAYKGGYSARVEFSPGLLCEDNSVDASALSCGFKADAKLSMTHGNRSRLYLDASYETVNGIERYLGGLGFGYRFGPKRALELGFNLDAGAAGTRQEARAQLQVRVAQ